VTGRLTDAQAETLVALVQGALGARRDYERVAAETSAESMGSDWDRRVFAAHDAALAAEDAAVTAIRALRGAS
jgi:hypothetical protein